MTSFRPSDVRLPEAVAKAYGEDWKESGVAEVVIVAHLEGGKVLLEPRILIDGLAAHRCWVVRIASAAGERYLQSGLTYKVEPHVDREAQVAAVARNEITKAKTETRRDLPKVDTPGAVERIGVTADIALTVERDGAAGGDDSSRKDSVVVTENKLGTQAEVSAEREPIERGVARTEVQIDADVCPSS